MKKNKNKKENLKICVHIPLYLDNSKKKQVKNFKKVCNSFLKFSKKVNIFVHTNRVIKFKNKKIKYLSYNFKNDHPYYLTWYCRKLMFKQKNSYDVFVYCEDDIFFSKKNFTYWLKNKDLCLKNNFNLGFLRVETKNKTLYSADQVEQSNQWLKLESKKFLVIKNPHCSFWIYDKKEFNDFTKTKYFHLKWKLFSISGVLLIREMATYGWHGIDIRGKDMGRYLATIISLKKNKYLVGYNLRFHPFIKKLKQELKGDKIYAVNMICNSYLPNWRANIPYNKSSSASVKKGGGVLLDLSHELDYLSYLVGSYSHLYSKNLKVSELKINTDDCLFLVGSIKRGGFFSMHLNYFSKNLTRELFIETQTKSIHLDLVNSKLKYYFPKKKPLEKKLKYSIDKTYVDQHKAILSADYKTVCSLKEARNVMNIIDKIQNFNSINSLN